MYIYVDIFLGRAAAPQADLQPASAPPPLRAKDIYIYIYISSCFLGPRPWHIEIRHRIKKHPQLICSGLGLSNIRIYIYIYIHRQTKRRKTNKIGGIIKFHCYFVFVNYNVI